VNPKYDVSVKKKIAERGFPNYKFFVTMFCTSMQITQPKPDKNTLKR